MAHTLELWYNYTCSLLLSIVWSSLPLHYLFVTFTHSQQDHYAEPAGHGACLLHISRPSSGQRLFLYSIPRFHSTIPFHHFQTVRNNLVVILFTKEWVWLCHKSVTSLVPRPFWEGETAWQLPRVQTVYGCNVTAIAYLIQAVKST